MSMRVVTGDPDNDEVLNWLNIHSVSMTQGLPLHLLQEKWRRAGRDDGRLGACLKRLFDQGLIMLTPGVEPPHLRFTALGFGRLLSAQPVAAPSAHTVTVAAADSPDTSPAARPVRRAGQAAAAAVQSAESAAVAAPKPRTFMSAGRAPSEIALRNQIISIYRDLRLKAESRLIGITLSRYWQEMGLRAGDLRVGLDLMMRDGYLRHRLDGMDVFWVLTPEGAAYLEGPLTPEELLGQAPPIGNLGRAIPEEDLRREVVHRVLSLVGRDAADYNGLRSSWQTTTGWDDHALIHGLDLLLKAAYLEMLRNEPLRFRLTSAGTAFAQSQGGMLSRLAARLGRALG